MRYIITALLFLLCATTAPAGVFVGFGEESDINYLLEQGFEGSGYDNSETWTEYVGSGATVNEDYTGTVLAGSQSLRLVGGTDWAETYSDFAATGTIYGYIIIRPVDLPSGATNIISVRNGATELLNLQLRADGTISSQGPNNTSYGSYAMSTGTTYHIWFMYSKGTGSNAAWWVKISDTSSIPASNDTSGSTGSATSDATRINLSMVGVDNEIILDRVLISDSAIGAAP